MPLAPNPHWDEIQTRCSRNAWLLYYPALVLTREPVVREGQRVVVRPGADIAVGATLAL